MSELAQTLDNSTVRHTGRKDDNFRQLRMCNPRYGATCHLLLRSVRKAFGRERR
jgi:hypothetical protein